ncbi:uncharacterized protein LOC126734909 [Anthonomus grandis grandis]|uniref:uncharacterized protein LOC126734909 n=1 Tax=Anthonomus grandis grandis TaxID=2921223 RepID=UPI002166B259|nr:uncharacterized protein LOC126734909 [Anthonomus grandis grandis]
MSAASPLLFLLKLAWDCRFRLPLLITVGFMVLDVRMQLDLNIQMRQIPRPMNEARPQGQGHVSNRHREQDGEHSDGSLSDSSWSTVDETEITDDE